MNVSICCPTLNRYDLLEKMIESGESGTLKPSNYYIIDNGGGLSLLKDKVTVIRPGKNLGVAASWNWFMKNVPEIRIIANDDVIFFPDTIERLANWSIENPNELLLYPAGISSYNVFSLFLITDKCRDTIGYFDENFYPAYFEDNDYYHRMIMSGARVYGVEGCNYGHEASSTIKIFTTQERNKHNEAFKKNKEFYITKWGGEPTHEKYRTAFNKG